MSLIYKYTLVIAEEQRVAMAKGAKILCIQMQYGQPRVWVAIDEFENDPAERIFYVVGTGWSIPSAGRYIGTVQEDQGTFVWHFFDGGEI